MGMHLALCDARDIIDEMKRRVGNRGIPLDDTTC